MRVRTKETSDFQDFLSIKNLGFYKLINNFIQSEIKWIWLESYWRLPKWIRLK